MAISPFFSKIGKKKLGKSNSAYVSAYRRLNQGKASRVILHVVFSSGDEAESPPRLQHPQNNLICYDEKTKVISSSFVRLLSQDLGSKHDLLMTAVELSLISMYVGTR